MGEVNRKIDVITLCGADGEIRPLRIRAQGGEEADICGNVCDIICSKDIIKAGSEIKIFLCRIRTDERIVIVELKYFARMHSWFLTRQLY